MIELIQVTNDPAFAQRCERLGGFRIWVDLERLGKQERQAGRNTFISTHQLEDVGRVRQALRSARLMVRVNPLNEGTAAEVDAVLAQGADLLMLPMFRTPAELQTFCRIVGGRVPVVPLLETADALDLEYDGSTVGSLEDAVAGISLDDAEEAILKRLNRQLAERSTSLEPVALDPRTFAEAEERAHRFRSPAQPE